jgi:thioredoxin 1
MADKKTRVQEITNLLQYDETLNASVNSLVVIGFGAVWCGPCRSFSRKLDEISLEYSKVVFSHIDIDVQELAILKILEHVERVPTFMFIRNYEIVASFTGASEQKLVSTIKELQAKFEEKEKETAPKVEAVESFIESVKKAVSSEAADKPSKAESAKDKIEPLDKKVIAELKECLDKDDCCVKK